MSSAHLTYLTASPKSAMQQVPFFFTKMFLDLMSLWAMAGFPAANKHAQLKSCSDYSQVTSSSPSLPLIPANPYVETSYPSQIPLLFFSLLSPLKPFKFHSDALQTSNFCHIKAYWFSFVLTSTNIWECPNWYSVLLLSQPYLKEMQPKNWKQQTFEELTPGSKDFDVQMSQATDGWMSENKHFRGVQHTRLEIVMKWPVLMVVCDQKQLRPWPCALDISCNEPWIKKKSTQKRCNHTEP